MMQCTRHRSRLLKNSRSGIQHDDGKTSGKGRWNALLEHAAQTEIGVSNWRDSDRMMKAWYRRCIDGAKRQSQCRERIRMSVYIHHIETLLPPHAYTQDYAQDWMTERLPGKRARRLIRGIYRHSGIQTRYSVLPDFGPDGTPTLFRQDASGQLRDPTTEQRNNTYAEWAPELCAQVARNAVAHAEGFQPADITHVITVSCTGFCNPGPDLAVIKGLELPDSVERYHIGFMGCYAAFPALRMARQFCQARREAVVLVVCVELCSLHLQLSEVPDSLLANALFADGAAAALVSARRPAGSTTALALHDFTSALALQGADDMTWSIGNHGFNIRLSTYVPEIIASHIAEIVARCLRDSPWEREDIGIWAVHPGGRAIVDKVQKELELGPAQVADSRTVLNDFGNMSCVTILFVLKRLLARKDELATRPVCAMAFGPGLTIETALLESVAMPDRAAPAREQSVCHV